MKSDVETLTPTRVRLTVQVPFAELEPSLATAYRAIGSQVRVPGFRPGKVPARIIDQRFGRAAVLEQAVNDALPKLYGQAVDEKELKVIGSPEVEVTELNDGQELTFTAEVDVRPEIELPDYVGLEASVDDAVVTDEQVDEQVETLRDRFAVLTGVDRPAQAGDYVSLDLAASIDGKEIDSATGQSYELGSGTMLDGLDDAVTGKSAGESTTFTSTIAGGEHAGKQAEVAVTIGNVKLKELPDLDDEFAQTASEFDTLDELRADVRERIERIAKLQQGVEARDKVLEALLAKVDVPLPESVVAAEVDFRRQALGEQVEMAGLTMEGYLAAEGKSQEEFDADLEKRAREAVTSQFVLDAIAQKEQLSVGEQELTDQILRRAQRAGVSPDQFAQQVVSAGQIPVLVNEVVRGKALELVLQSAKVTDASGNEVDLEALAEPAASPATGQTVEVAEPATDDEHDHD